MRYSINIHQDYPAKPKQNAQLGIFVYAPILRIINIRAQIQEILEKYAEEDIGNEDSQ